GAPARTLECESARRLRCVGIAERARSRAAYTLVSAAAERRIHRTLQSVPRAVVSEHAGAARRAGLVGAWTTARRRFSDHERRPRHRGHERRLRRTGMGATRLAREATPCGRSRWRRVRRPPSRTERALALHLCVELAGGERERRAVGQSPPHVASTRDLQ